MLNLSTYFTENLINKPPNIKNKYLTIAYKDIQNWKFNFLQTFHKPQFFGKYLTDTQWIVRVEI